MAIVGSGAGGAAAAAALAEAGLDVVVLEAGGYMDRDTYPRDPAAAIAALYRDGGLTIADGRPAIPVPVGRAVGGTTVINSGTALRAPAPVLERWRAEDGIEWATALEREFSEAEEELRVRRVDVASMGRNGQLAMEGADAIGARGRPLPRNAGRCVQCSSCPPAAAWTRSAPCTSATCRGPSRPERASGRGSRRAGCSSRRAHGAAGVECVAGGPRTAGGAGTSSARGRWSPPAGRWGPPSCCCARASAGPPLGRNLHIHPAAWIGARFDEPVRGWEGVMQSYAVDEWADRGLLEATFTPLAFGAQWLPGTGRAPAAGRSTTSTSRRSGSISAIGRPAGCALPGTGPCDSATGSARGGGATIGYGIARAAEIMFAAGAREVYPQLSGLPVIARGGLHALEAAAQPRRASTRGLPPDGDSRDGRRPGRSASRRDGAVRGTDGLYVADAACCRAPSGSTR